MSLHDCVINWDAPAILRDPNLPNTQGAEWVGDPAYGGTVGGAVRQFRALLAEQQKTGRDVDDPGSSPVSLRLS